MAPCWIGTLMMMTHVLGLELGAFLAKSRFCELLFDLNYCWTLMGSLCIDFFL